MLAATSNSSSTSVESQGFGEDKGLLGEEEVCPAANYSPIRRWYHRAWIAFTGINAVLACISIYAITTSVHCASRTQGWNTELFDARRAIQYEERAYTGALTFDRSKGGATRLNDGEMEFFGPPSPAIEASWEYLLHGMCSSSLRGRLFDLPRRLIAMCIDEFPTMTEKEAEPFKPELLPLRKDNQYHFE